MGNQQYISVDYFNEGDRVILHYFNHRGKASKLKGIIAKDDEGELYFRHDVKKEQNRWFMGFALVDDPVKFKWEKEPK